jgi:hypothetical protein
MKMKKTLSLLILVLTFSVSTFAQSGPAFKFKESNNTFDFGSVKEGPDAVHVFEFTNTGDQPILIQTAESSCGCTTPDWPKAPILPGKTGKITVKYNTANRVGPINKSIYIKSNASRVPVELKITGNVVK